MSKTTRIVIAVALLLAFLAWLFYSIIPLGSIGDDDDRPVVKSYEPTFRDEGDLYFLKNNDTIHKIDIEIAESQEEISYGMMYRKSIDENTGMLFLMPDERKQSFWMKNTYVPLDIIFINSSGEIVSIQKNARPLDVTSLPSEGPASMVLEVAGGFSDHNNIGKGNKISFTR